MQSYPRFSRGLLAGGVALGALVSATGALAQSTAPESRATTVQEVTVTANKRDEKLHDVAVSETALSGRDLQVRQAVPA